MKGRWRILLVHAMLTVSTLPLLTVRMPATVAQEVAAAAVPSSVETVILLQSYLPELELYLHVPLRVTSKEDVLSIFQTTLVAACALMRLRMHAKSSARQVGACFFCTVTSNSQATQWMMCRAG
jgi:hypothetical protein